MLMLLDFRVRQRDFLLEISRAITAQLELSEVLRRVLNASVVMLGGQVGVITLRDSDGSYRVRATMGVDTARVAAINEQIQQVFAGEALDYDTLSAKLSEIAVTLDKRLKQPFALPLIFAGEPLGLLIVFRSYIATATPDDMQVLESFADQAAIAVHNAQLYERIDHERRRLAAILQHSADGVMILDAQARILSINHALERMTGWASADAVGRDQDEVITWKKLERGDLKRALDDGWPFKGGAGAPDSLYVEGDLLRRDGLTVSLGIVYSPLLTTDGRLSNIVANVRDITNFRQAQEMQNTFISTISHELKTPVALIKGHAATLRREDVEWDKQVVRDYSAVIEDEADRLAVLIDDLLTTSRLQTQRSLNLNVDDVHLDQLAERAVERFSTQSTIHQFRLNFPPDFPSIQGDQQRLRQVIDNLLSNAIKYSPDGGEIEVGGSVGDRQVTIYVRDQGVGLT
ncbi:MAG: PAS domain S-box protein, partial [Anaerolineae bacterium]|nr:PAS domain S-box protein [Anaerolineae bacterium]